MGLDAVELVMAMEETFDITFSDAEAERIRTPRDAIHLIASKLEISQQPQCLTQTAFYFLREKVVNGCHALSRSQVRTNTNLREMIPKELHSWVWKTIADAEKVRLPGLERPRWLMWLIGGLSMSVAILTTVGLLWIVEPMGILGSVVVGLCMTYLVGTFGLYLTRPYRREIPARYGEISNLVKILVLRNPNFFKKNKTQWTYKQIQTMMRYLVMEVLGTKEYHQDWRFVEDFGID